MCIHVITSTPMQMLWTFLTCQQLTLSYGFGCGLQWVENYFSRQNLNCFIETITIDTKVTFFYIYILCILLLNSLNLFSSVPLSVFLTHLVQSKCKVHHWETKSTARCLKVIHVIKYRLLLSLSAVQRVFVTLTALF